MPGIPKRLSALSLESVKRNKGRIEDRLKSPGRLGSFGNQRKWLDKDERRGNWPRAYPRS
jgi:hypothetical protein